MIEMKEIKAQLEVAKTLAEDFKAMYVDTKVQLKDTKTQLKDSKAEISELEKKLAKMVEYAKDPCKNCKGPTVCLDGKYLGNTPEHGTMIRASNDFGTVDTVQYGRPGVKWNTLGNRACEDFTKFVYKCK